MNTTNSTLPVRSFRHWREIIRYIRRTTECTGLKIRFDASFPCLIVTDDEGFEIWIEGGRWHHTEDIDGSHIALPAYMVLGLDDYLGGDSTAQAKLLTSKSAALSIIRAWLDHTRDITVENLSWTLQNLD